MRVRWVSNLTPRRRETMVFSKEATEQRKAYLEQAEAVARELGKLASASVRMLGFLGDEGPDKRRLGPILSSARRHACRRCGLLRASKGSSVCSGSLLQSSNPAILCPHRARARFATGTRLCRRGLH
jgi:hypothetical protein